MDLDRILLVEKKKKYVSSVEYCNWEEGKLVSVKTREDMNKICNKYPTKLTDTPVRIGLYFKENVGTWQDGDNYDVNNNITVDNPENNCKVNQRCEVTMNCKKKKFEKWPMNRPFPFEDETLSSYFLCYKDLVTTTATTIAQTTAQTTAQTIIPAIPELVYEESPRQMQFIRSVTIAEVVVGDTVDAIEQTTVADPTKEKPKLGLILGLVFGLLALVIIIVVIVFCICHHKKKKQRKIAEENKGDEENGEEAAEEEE